MSVVGLRSRVPSTQDLSRYTWFFAALAYVAVMSVTSSYMTWDTWAPLAFFPILYAITVPLLKRGLRKDPDPMIQRIVVFAFVAKMAGTVARYVLTYQLYERADASEYHRAGTALANAFHDGTFAQVSAVEVPDLTGTPFINLVTGIVYIITKPTILGGFMIFGWLSFLGLFFFYKAVVVGFPEANHRRYAYLVFFLPSMIYWPSSIGKEAWISFGLGLASYGIALITRHQPLGYPTAALGLLAISGPRPHIAVLCTVALFSAYTLRRRSWRDATLGPVGKVVGLVVLLAVGAAVVSKAAAFFDLQEVNSQSVTGVIDYANQQSGQGGSEFEAAPARSLGDFPAATLAVLFRPWPWEAGSMQALIASGEGTLLVALFAVSWRRLVRLPKYLFQVPYVAYATTYVVLFVIAFSSIGNFGILTRQRTQVLPLVCVLLVLPFEQTRVDRSAPSLEERVRDLRQSPARPTPLS